jgi:glycosyltransferase involved in cell wall biosynthesis
LGLARTDNADVFLSVGDWNRDKGLDRVPSLLERYVEHSGRKVVWIGVGSALDPARFAEIEAKKESWPFEAHLIGTRIKHERLLALLDHADFYVMMQRKSIFDLATLEAMRGGKPLVLSPVGGNVEVDLNNNVVFVTEDTMDDACRDIVSRDRLEWGERNRAVYDKHFSVAHFADRYRAMLDEQFAALRDDDPERGRLNDLP